MDNENIIEPSDADMCVCPESVYKYVRELEHQVSCLSALVKVRQHDFLLIKSNSHTSPLIINKRQIVAILPYETGLWQIWVNTVRSYDESPFSIIIDEHWYKNLCSSLNCKEN